MSTNPQRLGKYELLERLGHGGMAEVWLARRADGALRREVALKLPMQNRLHAGLGARFSRERALDIAKFFGARRTHS